MKYLLIILLPCIGWGMEESSCKTKKRQKTRNLEDQFKFNVQKPWSRYFMLSKSYDQLPHLPLTLDTNKITQDPHAKKE